MNKIKKYLLIILGVIILITGGWFIFDGIYPIAFVGFKSISAKDFNKNYNASLNYYKKALETYSHDSKTLEADESKKEIKRAVLDNLIESVLIEEELKNELASKDFNILVEKKMSEISETQIVDKAVETLYGFSYAEFRKRVLEPQAKREIFEGRIALKGENFSDKLTEMKKAARVKIFISGLEWENGSVVIK